MLSLVKMEKKMHASIDELIYPAWGSEQWICEGWDELEPEEKQEITERVERLFKQGLPFKLIHEKILYIYLFSVLAQLEVFAIQLPLRFADKIEDPYLKERMRAQLLDEIFHAIVFTRVTFLLSAPYAFPPAYNKKIEEISLYVRSITCPKIGFVVINLITEGLVEEIFLAMYNNNIAPEVFKVILEDEQRHVCETELYREIGLPDKDRLEDELKKIEELLISVFFLESHYATAIGALLGLRAGQALIKTVHEKYIRQLTSIGMTPTDSSELAFQVATHFSTEFKPEVDEDPNQLYQEISEIEMSPMRKILMTAFNSPGNPTMTVEFDLDISDFGFFDNQYSHELLTPLVMQTLSHVLISNDNLRDFLSYKKTHRSQGAYVSVIEKLPDCDELMGDIVFRNCHESNTDTLLEKINQHKHSMADAYKKRIELDLELPELKDDVQSILYNGVYDLYSYPSPGRHGVCLINLGHLGFTKVNVPLSKHMGLRASLLTVKRAEVWNNESKSFDRRDLLPISLSVDLRLFDWVSPIPDLMNQAFQIMLKKMIKEKNDSLAKPNLPSNDLDKLIDNSNFKKLIDKLLNESKELGYVALCLMEIRSFDYIATEDSFNNLYQKVANDRLNKLADFLRSKNMPIDLMSV